MKMKEIDKQKETDWNKIRDSLNSLMPEGTKIDDSQQINIMKFINSFSNLRFDCNKIKLAKDFLNSAKDNLILYKVAYQKKRYATAIFNLVLATEKIIKSYGLATFGIEKKDLFNIGHDSPITFKILMEKEPYKSYLEILNTLQPNIINKDPKEIKEFVSDNTKINEILKASEEKINLLINSYEKADKIFDENINKKISNVVNKSLSLISEKSQSLKDRLDFSIMPQLVSSFTKLACVSFITFPHYFTSNYPDTDKIGYSNYNKNLGIVKASPRIYKILNSAIEHLEVYLDKVDSVNKPNNVGGK
ncbi:MAG: hypothetical protein QW117_00680 [Candidatus Pacearchaeota archaeon]